MKSAYINHILLITLLFLPLSSKANLTPLQVMLHEFAPHSYLDANNQPQGILIELALEICKKWTAPCDVAVRPNRRAQFLFESGEVQARFLAWNPERAVSMWFSVPMVQTEYGFFSLKSDPINNLEQLSNKTVGVYGPSNTHRSLTVEQSKLMKLGRPPFDTDIYPQGNELPLRMLQKKRFHAYYANKEGGYFYADKIGLTELNYFSADRQVYYNVAFNKDYTNYDTVKTFNHLFSQLLTQGKLNHVYQKWQMVPAYLDPVMYPEMSIPY